MSSTGKVSAQSERAAVLQFRGRGGAQARAAVIKAARGKLDLASRDDVETGARDTGVDLSTPQGMGEAAKAQGLTLIISGEVEGRGGAARTHIHIYDDQGNEVAYREAARPTPRRNRRFIESAAAEAIDQALGAVAQRRRDEIAEQERLERARMAAAEAAATDGDSPEDEVEEADSDGVPALPLIVGLVGLDGRTRIADVDFPMGGGRRYELNMYPELSLRLESFPLGSSEGAVRGIYAQVDFAYALSLSSQRVDALGNPIGDPIDSNAWRLWINAGYIYPVSDDAFRVGVLVGFGIWSFSIDENDTLPSTKYTMLRLGAVADAQIYEQLLRARVDFGYRIVFGVGDIANGDDRSFGDDASGGAFDIGLSLGGHLDLGFAYALRFGFTRYRFAFSGMSGAGIPSDGTMTDKGFNLSAQVGWAL